MDAKLTAYALNELPPDERAAFEAQLKNDPALQKQADEMKDFCKLLEQEVAQNADDTLMPAQREQLVRSFQNTHVIIRPLWRRPVFLNTLGLAAAACFAVMLAVQHLKEEPLATAQAYMDAEIDTPASKKRDSLNQGGPRPEVEHAKRVQVSPVNKEGERLRQSGNIAPQPAAPQVPPVADSALRGSMAEAMPVVPHAAADKPAFTPEPKMAAAEKPGARNYSLDKIASDLSPGDRDRSGLGAGGGIGGLKEGERANAYSAVTSVSSGKDSSFKSDVGVVNQDKGQKKLEGVGSRALTEAGAPIDGGLDKHEELYSDRKSIARADGTKLPSSDAAEKAGKGNEVFFSTATPPAKSKSELAVGNTSEVSGLTKSGTGTLDLAGAITYAGGTTISAGELKANKNTALVDDTKANNTLSFNGGTITAVGNSQISGADSIAPIPQAASGGRGEHDINGRPAVSGPSVNSPVVARTKEASAVYDEHNVSIAPSSRQVPQPAAAPVDRSVDGGIGDVRGGGFGKADELTIAPRREMLGRIPDEQPVDAPRPASTATYRPIIENPFTYVAQQPLSTFSLDVDTASYANVRRLLNSGQRPPSDAVRLEELVNYFPYQYKGPAADRPIAVQVDLGEAPWQPLHRIARVAVKAREVKDKRSAANFVFLLDVSGSMKPQERLPLIKQSLRMLVDQLSEDDQVAIVTYAGESGVVLESTSGAKKEKIQQAIEKLKAGGSTNGASGIQLAYEQAASNFSKERNNRVILCTDGDFNVGTSSVLELEKLIAEKSKSGVFLSVLGVGTGNLRDHTMQALADRGNGNYNYLDSVGEARKVLVEQMTGTLVTVAKDVKLQVEFNPAQVAAYRLIGYEKRMLAKEDFNNDKKDAGEIGAGHTVTALYEVVPASLKYPDGKPLVDDLKYLQASKSKKAEEESDEKDADAPMTGETLTVKVRYKEPDGDQSKLFEVAVTDAQKKLSENDRDFQFAVSVAGFGMLLRGSPNAGELTWENVRRLALSGKGDDEQGWRGEFIQLIEKARGLCEERR